MTRNQENSGLNSVADPQQWQLPDPAHVITTLESRKRSMAAKRPQGSHWVFSSNIAPVDLYAYLKFRFGPPNGFAMTLRSPSVDNLIHWNYTLECQDSIIDLHGMDTEINVHAYTAAVSDSEWKALESGLLSEFKLNNRALERVKQEFEKWHLFVNPYRRLTSIIERYESRLIQIDMQVPKPPSIPANKQELARFHEEMKRAVNLQKEAIALCVSLEMIAPVMGEAAVNLLLLLLAKSELRNDKRLIEKFSRNQIDVRIKSLHLHCDGFTTPVPSSDERFRNFLRVMNKRNDTLHGNIDPKKDFGEIVYFDQCNIPLPTEQNSFPEITLKHMMADLSKERALSSVNAIREFVGLLTDSLKPETKMLVQHFMNEHLLGRESKTGRIGSILPSVRVAAYPGGE